MPGTDATSWTVVLPVKPFTLGKSRLGSWAGDLRPDWARAFFLDTLNSVVRTPGVERVIVVSGDPQARTLAVRAGADAVDDTPARGLNAAVRRGAGRAAARSAGPVAIVTADLPALRPGELARVLAEAGARPRAFLADHTGHGTTVLTAHTPGLLLPRFEGASRARHAASGAHEIANPQVPGARLDVDTPTELVAALRLGLGPHSTSLASTLGPERPMSMYADVWSLPQVAEVEQSVAEGREAW